jgi:hypothetical protein
VTNAPEFFKVQQYRFDAAPTFPFLPYDPRRSTDLPGNGPAGWSPNGGKSGDTYNVHIQNLNNGGVEHEAITRRSGAPESQDQGHRHARDLRLRLMSFLTLNGTPIRCRKDACDVKDAEHRADRARAFDGTPRVTSGGVFREFTIVTGLLNATDYAAYRALINTSNPPLTAAGDLIGATSISVFPIPGSWTPLATPSESNGFRRQAKFTLWESPTISAPDTSAVPWAFYRRNVGLYTDLGFDNYLGTVTTTTAAGDGDSVGVWTDQTGNLRHALSGHGVAGGVDDQRPTYDAATKSLRCGDGPGFEGRTGFRVPYLGALADLEIMIGLRVDDDPPTQGYGLWRLREGSGATYYPDNDGHIKESMGDTAQHDAGDPTADLAGFNCYDVSANGTTKDLIVRLNDDVLLTVNVAAGFFFTGGTTSYGPMVAVAGGDSHYLVGNIRDMVIFDAVLTDSQRLAWKRYILGLTSTPPL